MRCKIDVIFAQNQLEDCNHIENLIYLDYFLSTVRLILMLSNIAMIFAMIWYTFIHMEFHLIKDIV